MRETKTGFDTTQSRVLFLGCGQMGTGLREKLAIRMSKPRDDVSERTIEQTVFVSQTPLLMTSLKSDLVPSCSARDM